MNATNWHKRKSNPFPVNAQASQREGGVILRLHTIGSDNVTFLDVNLSPEEAMLLARELETAARAQGYKVTR